MERKEYLVIHASGEGEPTIEMLTSDVIKRWLKELEED